MSQCYECVHYSVFFHCCYCRAKNIAYRNPIWKRTYVSGEAPACDFFVDIDEVM